jgi:hypothetical protein
MPEFFHKELQEQSYLLMIGVGMLIQILLGGLRLTGSGSITEWNVITGHCHHE